MSRMRSRSRRRRRRCWHVSAKSMCWSTTQGSRATNLLLRMKKADWDDVLQTNLTGTFLLSQALIGSMMKARYGRIINISSVVGRMGQAGQANYAASKAGLIGFTKSLARELASRGVTANVVAPGYIESPMTAVLDEKQNQAIVAHIPLGRIGKDADVAHAVAFSGCRRIWLHYGTCSGCEWRDVYGVSGACWVSIPPRLKPDLLGLSYGTAEAVPLPGKVKDGESDSPTVVIGRGTEDGGFDSPIEARCGLNGYRQAAGTPDGIGAVFTTASVLPLRLASWALTSAPRSMAMAMI